VEEDDRRQPGSRPARRDRAGGHGDRGRGGPGGGEGTRRAVSGQCPASARSCGPHDMLSVRAGLAGRLVAIYVTSALAATGMRRSRRAVP